MGAAALDAFAFDAGDAAVLAHADLEPDVGLRPAAMGDEGLLAIDHDAHAAAGLAREQRGDQFDIERLGAAAETAADMRLDHADARHVHGEDLRQHQVHVIRHLGRGMHGDAVAHHVVVGDRGVHLHLVLAHLGAIVGAFADQIGRRKGRFDIAELEQNVALEILRLAVVNGDGVRRHRFVRRVIGRKLAHLQLDAPQRFLRGRIVDRGDGGDRLAAIAHAIARQRMLAAGDRQHAKSLVAIGAGDDGFHARQLRRLGDIDVENLGVRIGTAENSPGQHSRRDEIGGVLGAAGDLLRAVDHRHVVADVMRRHDLVHGDNSGRMQRGGVLHRLDDFDVAGAAANVAAERVADFVVGRPRIAPQQSGRRHDESRRAIAALRAELFVEAALHRGEVAVDRQRFDGVDAAAVDHCRERQARQARRSSTSTVQAPHSPPSQPVFVPVSPTCSRK